MSTWLAEDDDPRTFGNPVGEKATYEEYLRNYRLTLALKCRGLTPEQLAARSVSPSTLSLLGLVRHMARVEHSWFQRVIHATGEDRLFWTADNHDHDFDAAEGTQECVDEAFAAWEREVGKAEAWLRALPEEDLGRVVELPDHDGEVISLRDLLVHMIEEYARHCGHADLLRECIDGRTGQ